MVECNLKKIQGFSQTKIRDKNIDKPVVNRTASDRKILLRIIATLKNVTAKEYVIKIDLLYIILLSCSPIKDDFFEFQLVSFNKVKTEKKKYDG